MTESETYRYDFTHTTTDESGDTCAYNNTIEMDADGITLTSNDGSEGEVYFLREEMDIIVRVYQERKEAEKLEKDKDRKIQLLEETVARLEREKRDLTTERQLADMKRAAETYRPPQTYGLPGYRSPFWYGR